MSLVLQQAFGLRSEEAIKFRPGYADQGDFIVLKGSWTKGGSELYRSQHRSSGSYWMLHTSWLGLAPAARGASTKVLIPEQCVQDQGARQVISRELGHQRLAITAVYLGR